MTMIKSISSPNQVVLSSQIMMDEQSHASSMDESGVMNSVQEFTSNLCSNESPQSPSSHAASMIDESTVYENASTDSSDIEEASEAPDHVSPLEATKPLLYKPPSPPPPRQEEQDDSNNNNFPVISLHDSQHSVVSGLTMGLTQSFHKDPKQDQIDKLRAELLMLKKNVLQEGEISKDELVNCLDRIHEELGVEQLKSSSEVTMDVVDEDYEGSDQEGNSRGSGRRRKKSKDRGGRKTPRSASRKKKKSAKLGEISAPPLSVDGGPPKTPTSSNKGRQRISGGSSRRKQRTIKAHSERASRKSAPVLDSEDLRRILKGEGAYKLSKEERSQDTRSTKSSTKSKGRSSSLNPKNRSPKNSMEFSLGDSNRSPKNSMEFSLGDGNGKRSTKPKTKMQSTNPILDFSGALGDNSNLKKKTAPRRKSAPMNVTDFDQFVLRQKEKEAEKSEELQLELAQKEQQPRVRGQSKKKKKMARRQSAPMPNIASFDLEAFVKQNFDNFQALLQDESFDTTSKSASITVSTTSKDALTISTNSKDGDEESTSKKKKKKKKKVSSSRRQSMSAIYTDPTGQIKRVDLSPARHVSPARSNADDGSATLGRKKKKSRKPKNRRASMEADMVLMNKPIGLSRQTTFDGVIQRYQKPVMAEEEEETPITSKKKKQPRRASITDFTFVSNHSYVDGYSGHEVEDLGAPPTKKSSKTKKKEPNAHVAADMNVAATLASLKMKQQQDSFDVSSRSERSGKVYVKPTSSKNKPESTKSKSTQQQESFNDSWLVDESDSPVPVVKRSKMQQAKRKSSKFFSKTVAALVSPRSSRLKLKLNKKDEDPFSA